MGSIGEHTGPGTGGTRGGTELFCDRRCVGDPADITSAPIRPTRSLRRDLHRQFSADLHSVFLLLSTELKVISAQLLSEKDIEPISV